MGQVINFAAAKQDRRIAAKVAAIETAAATRAAKRRAEIVDAFKDMGPQGELFGHILADVQQAAEERKAADRPTPAYCDPANERVGAKYEATRHLGVREIAQRMRADIAEAKANGKLPQAVKTSINIRRFSGGCSIDLRIVAIPADMTMHNADRLRWERDNPHEGYHMCPYRENWTPEAAAILATCEQIHASYNRDNSDSMTDYFDVNYYGHAEFDWQLRHDRKAAQLAQLED